MSVIIGEAIKVEIIFKGSSGNLSCNGDDVNAKYFCDLE